MLVPVLTDMCHAGPGQASFRGRIDQQERHDSIVRASTCILLRHQQAGHKHSFYLLRSTADGEERKNRGGVGGGKFWSVDRI